MGTIVNMPEEDRATDTGNMYKTLVTIVCVCGSGDILSDRQTDRQTHSAQYFATAHTGKVINKIYREYYIYTNYTIII